MVIIIIIYLVKLSGEPVKCFNDHSIIIYLNYYKRLVTVMSVTTIDNNYFKKKKQGKLPPPRVNNSYPWNEWRLEIFDDSRVIVRVALLVITLAVTDGRRRAKFLKK